MAEKREGGAAHRVGVISDTHGLLRPGVLEAFREVEMIIHAGDVGNKGVLDGLQALAPTVAVRGNMDSAKGVQTLPRRETLEIDGSLLYVLHDLNELDLDPGAAGIRAVISGHSHEPSGYERKGVLYLNPGSAGPGRFRLPATVAILLVAAGGRLEARLIGLER